VRRRSIIIAGLAKFLLASERSFAQKPSGQIPRIGVLSPADTDEAVTLQAFREGLRDLGYVEGRNILLEFRLAHGDSSLLPHLAEELVKLPVNVILVDGGPGVVRAVMELTDRIAIVSATGGDPVVTRVVSNLSHPGGNVTGFTLGHSELNGKRLEMLRAAFPGISTVAALVNSSNANASEYLKEIDDAARSVGVQKMVRVEVADLNALHSLKPVAFTGADGVMVLPDAVFWNHRGEIVALMDAVRLPAIYPERDYADDGGLMGYGANAPDNFRRAAEYVDRILKGTKPGDLPIQEPVKFDFVINLKTAKALGLTIPPSVLVRANEVIE
jgi:ABC-type uncharacterized transport system substrate-binding protein